MTRTSLVALLAIAALAAGATPALAHCDTVDGPVVAAARAAIDQGDAAPALAWVRERDEAEVRAALARALAARALGQPARDLADLWFFETVVRLHRAGEGEPYTGLRPAGTPLEAGVAAAEEALASGTADRLVEEVSAAAAAGLRRRLEAVLEARRHAGEGLAAARRSTAAYVEFVHHVERLHETAAGAAAGHGAEHPSRHP